VSRPGTVLGVLCEAADQDPKIARLAHAACHGNGEVRLPGDPPTARPVFEYRCDCACHQQLEEMRALAAHRERQARGESAGLPHDEAFRRVLGSADH
jgi:hypothetical protein